MCFIDELQKIYPSWNTEYLKHVSHCGLLSSLVLNITAAHKSASGNVF